MSNRLLASCAAAAALSAGCVSAANAAEEGWYFSLTGGMSMIDQSRGDFDSSYGVALMNALADDGFNTLDAASSFDDSNTAWGAQIGYQFMPYFAVEGGYITLGDGTYDLDLLVDDTILGGQVAFNTNLRLRSSGFTAAAVGILPLGQRFELNGRAGLLFARNRVRQQVRDLTDGTFLGSTELRGNSTDLFASLGGAWTINPNYTLALSYQRFFDVGDDEDTPEYSIDLLSLTLQFR